MVFGCTVILDGLPGETVILDGLPGEAVILDGLPSIAKCCCMGWDFLPTTVHFGAGNVLKKIQSPVTTTVQDQMAIKKLWSMQRGSWQKCWTGHLCLLASLHKPSKIRR